ncbi:MAG: dihydropteroate synthase [Emcibacteraceae bacterium]|nr:dihydropteroate synthase [Emcibacteraceae bacterium]MDG1996346.1 dihydropteroate synthase [Emcibacteraceae bacterium]
MDDIKTYIEPLAIARGLTVSDGRFLRICDTDLLCAALKIITREKDKISTEVVLVENLNDYLDAQLDTTRTSLEKTIKAISRERTAFDFKNKCQIKFDKPIIQGVLNVTPDSFSDGGTFASHDAAITHARDLVEAGAAVIDIGGESTKPGATPVTVGEELDRVIPVIEQISSLNVPISIDSRNSQVMREAINAGADIINDVSALEHDPKNMGVVVEMGVPVILMHALGNPETMQDNPDYQCAVLDIYDYLETRIDQCVRAGVSKEMIVIDPGIGFGKTVKHNVSLLAHISIFHGLGVPILVGVSRKSFIGKISGEEVAEERVYGSIAAAQFCLDHGVQIIRVHDVAETVQALLVRAEILTMVDKF